MVAVQLAAAVQQPAEAANSSLNDPLTPWLLPERQRTLSSGRFLKGLALSKDQRTPERSCVACGVKLPKAQLVRVARTAEGSVAVDVTGRAAGRGAAVLTKTSQEIIRDAAYICNRLADDIGPGSSVESNRSIRDQVTALLQRTMSQFRSGDETDRQAMVLVQNVILETIEDCTANTEI